MKLSSLIREVRRKRRFEDPSQLTDAELLVELANLLSDDPDERPLIACALAVNARSVSNSRRALESLEEVGISGFTPEQIAVLSQHEVFLELRAISDADLDDRRSTENFERVRDSAIKAGSIAMAARSSR